MSAALVLSPPEGALHPEGALYRARTLEPSPARAVLTNATARLWPISLPEVLSQAALQTRLDRKYVVPMGALPALFDRLGPRFRVLEIGQRRLFGYESIYFDTPDLLTYRDHVQGRRRRFKVRTRTYLDSGDCVLEVKSTGHRGETVKHRMEYDLTGRYRLDDAARRFVAGQVPAPGAVRLLRATLVNSYHRVTLVDVAGEVRLTCDVDLTGRAGPRVMSGLGEHVLVEAKTSRAITALDHAFHAVGVRSLSLSKYCVAVALLCDGVRTNPWHRTLRRYFALAERPGEARLLR
jgi:VTC domain